MDAKWKARNGAKTRLAAKHSTAVRKAMKASIDVKKIVGDFMSSHPDGNITPQDARDWAHRNIYIDNTDLKKVIGKIYGDSWVLGEAIAKEALAVVIRKQELGSKKFYTSDIVKAASAVDWSKWKAGNKGAAKLLNPPHGLSKLMQSRNVTLAGLNRTTTDRIGTQLAYALQRGLSPSSVSGNVSEILAPLRSKIADQMQADINSMMSDPERALMIAQTEMTRATEVASRNLYQDSGVELVEWLVADGCDICDENASASPIPIDDTFPSGDTEPPAHPNCMCDLAPYTVDTSAIGEDALALILDEAA